MSRAHEGAAASGQSRQVPYPRQSGALTAAARGRGAATLDVLVGAVHTYPLTPKTTAVRVAIPRVGGAREVTHDQGSLESACPALLKRTLGVDRDGSP